MIDREPVWMLIVDDREGRLVRGQRASAPTDGARRTQRRRLDLIDALQNPWRELDPSSARPSAGAPRDESEEVRRRAEFLGRYAGDLSRWLENHVRQHGIDELEVFATPRLVGALRHSCSPKLAERLAHHVDDLGRMSLDDLARHPSIAEVFEQD